MESIDYITAQAQLAKTMRRVCENDAPIAIDGAGKDRVVMVSLEYFEKQLQNDNPGSGFPSHTQTAPQAHCKP